jgi:glycine/D-amino acid oxidase-like deaminating enzyme
MKKKIGIIGGGVIGAAIAYFLSENPDADVTVFEKNTIGSGTTAKSAGTHCLIDDSVKHEFWSVRLFGFNFYVDLHKKYPGSVGFEKTGTLTVCPYDEYENYVLQAVDLTLASGYHAEYWRDPEKIHQIVPDLNLDGILGAGYCPDDGFFDATMATNTMIRIARENGAKVYTGTKLKIFASPTAKSPVWKPPRVTSILMSSLTPLARGRVSPAARLASSCLFTTPKPKSSLSNPANRLAIPSRCSNTPNFTRAKTKTASSSAKRTSPWTQRPAACRCLGSGCSADDRGTDPYFWDFLTEQLMEAYPRLLDSALENEWVGYRAEPPDFLPILGDTPVEGYMLAVGAGGNGVIEAPTIGRDMAQFIMTGEKSWYLKRLPYSRFAK